VKTEIMVNARKNKRRKKLNQIINLLRLPLAERAWKLQEGIIYEIIKEENLYNLILWNENLRNRKKKRNKLKQFLEGKVMEAMIDENEQKGILFAKEIIAIKIIDLRLSSDLQLEKKKKYKVKNVNAN
jgi:hypothetical protein